MVVFGRLISILLRNTQPDGIAQASMDFHREEKIYCRWWDSNPGPFSPWPKSAYRRHYAG